MSIRKQISIINEIYSKCLQQEKDINNEIIKINKGVYPVDTIDKVRTKIKEKIENFTNSIKLLTNSINEDNTISNNEYELWQRKKENLLLSIKSLSKSLDDCVTNLKRKHHLSLPNTDTFNVGNADFGRNISNLQQEQQSWHNVIRMSSEIESNTRNISSELDTQGNALSKINNTISSMYNKITKSYSSSSFMVSRGRNDTRLCLFLGIITIIIIYCSYYYLRPKIRNTIRILPK